MKNVERVAPPDQAQRERALAPDRSVLVQAPAGSGKTDLLTRRFLRLLAEVNDPGEIVAITFTKAAAAEMRHRILSELEKASHSNTADTDEFSMESLAARALQRSEVLGWNLLKLSAQLRISTIDSFCRELALQQPLLSGLGGGLDIAGQPGELYLRAARNTLQILGTRASPYTAELQAAIEDLLVWRDNNWQDVEDQLVEMLARRDRWMQDFVFEHAQDWEALRIRLERPFADALRDAIHAVDNLLAQVPHAKDEALALARFACEQSDGKMHGSLAELAEFPDEPDGAHHAYLALAEMLLTKDGAFRKTVNVSNGFPADRKKEKQRFLDLVQDMRSVSRLENTLAVLRTLPPAHYTEDDWRIVRACFTLLRHAAGELRVAFAEAGMVDYTEVSQMAQRVLEGSDHMPTDAAIAIADGIHHLLVDEFQDTSRRQHRLISSLVAAWPDTVNRSIFVVGDPMQSIYFFRDADAELFPRVQKIGLELPTGEAHTFDFAPLSSNFRTAPELVNRLNAMFGQVFGADSGSSITFSSAQPARTSQNNDPRLHLHLEFVPQIARSGDSDRKQQIATLRQAALDTQLQQIVTLIRSHAERMEQARARGEKYRIAVLGRTRNAVAPVAAALRAAAIPFRAVDLEPLAERPEVLDALSLGRALLNGEDRVAWLGVLRAPWCGLSLADLHTLTSADDAAIRRRAIPELLAERAALLSVEGLHAVTRLIQVFADAPAVRVALPIAALGTWLQQVWMRLGGADCVDAAARTNLDLLWGCLDRLQDGETDLLGHALDAVLGNLMAQPDPAAESDLGVHLMTIHKSKGLEFEVVIVPELQAGSMPTRNRMIAWLERGLAEQDDSGEITEFLVAPQQSKGEDRGLAKEWVDRVYRKRETQEMQRILYVAATRAREELHLFARPAYKENDEGLSLISPPDSLLATAWPALQSEIEQRFAAWNESAQPAEIEAIAAAGDNLLVMPASPASDSGKPAILRRLPQEYELPALPRVVAQADVAGPGVATSSGVAQPYARHEGGLLSRALGTAVHALFAETSRLRTAQDWDTTSENLYGFLPRIVAQIRSAGVEIAQAENLAEEALEIVLHSFSDKHAQWILEPYTDAASEIRWAGVLDGTLRTVQADRVFRAGSEPMTEGEDVWWIVDYKTAQADENDPATTLPELRKLFVPQLEIYARVLRLLHGNGISIRAGLYYPRMIQFDWWEI